MPRGKDKKVGVTESGADKTDRKQTTIYLPKDQYRSLKVYAAQNDLEMSEVVSEALKKFGIH
ncbi:MAG TPA: hypothetical protein VFF06_31520 [Polyangia bacterium]|nr:hypothetical protein [Polyangia bacterium]